MKSFPILSVLATILAMLVSEYIFHFPSKMLHDGGAPLVQITLPGISERDTTPITPKGETVYCTVEYAPVCGADSITYPNACEAGRSRTSVAYTGTCDNRKVEKPLYEEVAVSTGMMSPDTTPTVSTGSAISMTPTPPEPTVASSSGVAIFDTGSYHIYANNSLNYGFALPKFTYYQGYGVRDSAAHTMAVSLTATGIDIFDTADVRIWYYRKLPTDTTGKKIINLLDGGVVLIAGDESNPRVAKIIETVEQSTKNLQ